MKSFQECLPIFREIEEAQTIIIALGTKALGTDYLQMDDILGYKQKVEKGISDMQSSPNLTLDEVCFFMANNLSEQTGIIDGTIRLANFTYQDTKMGSSFSRRFSNVFRQKLISLGKYSIFAGTAKPVNIGTSNNGTKLITGTYWEEGDNLKIIAILREMESGKALASVEGKLPKSWLNKNNITFEPENFKEAYSKMQAFTKEEFIGGGLLVDIWTNKGNENLIYTKGERLKLYVRANKECYLRFIYYLADGSIVLMLNNYYVDSDKINKVIELPYEFECDEPFGVETLQLNAQSKEFKPLNTKKQYGYEFIQDNLGVVLSNTRGFKLVNNETMKAEKRLMITTLRE